VIDGVGLHASNQTDLVSNLCGMRENFTEFHPALTMLFILELWSQQSGVRINERRAIPFEKFSRRQLAISFGQLGLVIEHLQMAGSTGLENIDNSLGLAGEMRLPRCQRIRNRIRLSFIQIRRQQRSGRYGPKANAAISQKPSTAKIAGLSRVKIVHIHGGVLVRKGFEMAHGLDPDSTVFVHSGYLFL
jgi:hypothetical protein